jgi:hypothetical protein
MAEQKPAFEVFRDHLASLGVRIPPCPICQSVQWQFAKDLISTQVYKEDEPTMFTVGSGVPIAILACGKCFFFFPFVWAPIRSKADGNEPK